MAMCEMRGMYNYENVPPSAKILQPQENGCAWAGPSHSTIGCARVFYTPGCLLSCDDRHLRRAGRAGRAGGATMLAVDVEIDPQSCRFRRSQTNFALQAIVERRSAVAK